MLQWIIVVVVLVFVLGAFRPVLSRRFRLGRLPGDVRLRYRGREYHFPFTSTVLLSLCGWMILRLI